MSDEASKCPCCGDGNVAGGGDWRLCRKCRCSWDETRRLHGQRLTNLTTSRLAGALVRYGVIDASAVEDPNGYDGGTTLDALALAARDLSGLGHRLAPEHVAALGEE